MHRVGKGHNCSSAGRSMGATGTSDPHRIVHVDGSAHVAAGDNGVEGDDARCIRLCHAPQEGCVEVGAIGCWLAHLWILTCSIHATPVRGSCLKPLVAGQLAPQQHRDPDQCMQDIVRLASGRWDIPSTPL